MFLQNVQATPGLWPYAAAHDSSQAAHLMTPAQRADTIWVVCRARMLSTIMSPHAQAADTAVPAHPCCPIKEHAVFMERTPLRECIYEA